MAQVGISKLLHLAEHAKTSIASTISHTLGSLFAEQMTLLPYTGFGAGQE